MIVQPTNEFARGHAALPRRARRELDAVLRNMADVETIRDIPNAAPAYDGLYVVTQPGSRLFIAPGDADERTALLLAVKDATERRGPLPIVLGVTGHVDLRPQDVPSLENCVRTIFDDLLQRYPRTPLLLVSPLAAGADQLVARVAASYQIPIVAPLPLEEHEYRKDFKDPAADASFEILSDRAQCVFFVGYEGDAGPENVQLAEGQQQNAHRDAQYAKVGTYVARNSQILIALWDGRESDNTAGTAAIVRFKRTGRGAAYDELLRPLDRPEFGPVWHVSTPRLKTPGELPNPPFTIQVLQPEPSKTPQAPRQEKEPTSAEVTERIMQRMNRFNADALRIGVDDRTIRTETIRATAEALASRYQYWTKIARRALYFAAFFAAFAFVLYAHEPHHVIQFLLIDLALTIAALALYGYAQFRELQNYHQDYRAIAEGLRVQEQWHTANLRRTVADHYLRQYRGELDWIRNTIRVCRLLDENATTDDPGDPARRISIQAVYDSWIVGPNGQLDYYQNRADADEKRERRYGLAIAATAAVSIVVTVGMALAYGWLHREGVSYEDDPWWIASVISITLAAVASGFFASFADKLAHGIHVKRYRRIRGIFAYAGEQLAELLSHKDFSKGDYQRAQEVIFELGQEALTENAGWVILHRERPLEFPQG